MAETSIPVLSEHQSYKDVNTNTEPAGYSPTEEEKKTIKMVTRKFEKAKKDRKKYDEKWLDFYKMFRGKQWKETRPQYRHSEVINMVFQMIQSDVPLQLDSRPKFEFLPQEPSDYEFSKILNEIAQSDWDKKNWLYNLAEVIYDSRFYGTGIASMQYDPEANNDAGDIIFKAEDVFYCFPDHNASQINDKDSCYFITAVPTDIEVLKREYPDKAKYIKSDIEDLTMGDRTDLTQVRFKSPVDTKVTMEGTSPYDLKSNKILKIEMWCKSDEYDEEEKEEKDEQTGEVKKVYEQKLKYPKGRRICIAGGVLLSDGPNPYDDGKFPFAKYNTYIDPHSFWGIGDVEQLESPQKIFNKLVSFTLDVLTLMGNPIWVVDNTSGIDTDNLFNRPGLIVEKEPNSEVRREEGVQLQPFVMNLIDRMKTWFDDIGGNNDVSRGASSQGVTAASAITALQESAKTRIRQKSRNLDAFLQDQGQLYLSRVMQFSAAPKIYRLTNNEGAMQYFKMSIEKESDEYGNENKRATVMKYVQDENGQYLETAPTEYQIRGEFDVRVSTGSALPFAKSEKASLAFNLLKAGAIDEIELLKAVEYPNAEAVWQRVQEGRIQKQQQEMAMQQQAAAQGQPPAQ